MACNILTLCDPACSLPQGPTAQNMALVELLLRVLANLDPAAETDPDTILSENACLVCRSSGDLKRIWTNAICDGIAEIDCDRLHCLRPEQLEAIKTVAICGIVNALSP